MEFSQDEIAAVIGAQQLEIISLRRELARLAALAEEQRQKLEEKNGTT